MQRAEFANQAREELSGCPAQQIATANQERSSAPQPTHVLRRPSKPLVDGRTRKNHVHFLDGISPPFKKMVDPKRPDDMFLLQKRNYKIMASIGPTLSDTHIFSVIFGTGGRLNFPRED